MAYKKAIVVKGPNGWGTPLVIAPKEGQKIVSIVGGAINPVAQKISDITGAPVVDGFHHPVRDEECACAVIDCGGVARAGVLSRKKILTLNINGGGPSGPLAAFMKEGVYLTDVRPDGVSEYEE